MRVTCHAEGCCRRRPAVVAQWTWPTAIQRSWLPDLPTLFASVTQAWGTCTCQEHRGGIDWQEHGPYLCHAFSQGVGSGLASVAREGACAKPPRLAQPRPFFVWAGPDPGQGMEVPAHLRCHKCGFVEANLRVSGGANCRPPAAALPGSVEWIQGTPYWSTCTLCRCVAGMQAWANHGEQQARDWLKGSLKKALTELKSTADRQGWPLNGAASCLLCSSSPSCSVHTHRSNILHKHTL